MPNSVLVLGGTGNFGRRIVEGLRKRGVDVAGVSRKDFDVRCELDAQLDKLRPAVVVNTVGPFQGASYDVARSCIARGIHCIDLADARDFVTGIAALDADAKAKGIAVISGASTVPCLSSAVIEHFGVPVKSLVYGITPGQKVTPGPAATKAVLSYAGRKFHGIYGWQDIHRVAYPGLGKRWMGNCDIPDLDLLPARYGIERIRFSAGLELAVPHLGLWLLSWMVRLGLPLDLPRHAPLLWRMGRWFDVFGSADGGMHMFLTGRDGSERRWFIIARNGDGPQIPCVPAIVLARRALSGKLASGAYPCVGLLTLDEYLAELSGFDVSVA